MLNKTLANCLSVSVMYNLYGHRVFMIVVTFFVSFCMLFLSAGNQIVAQEVINKSFVTGGNAISEVGVNPTTNRIYVTNQFNDTVTVIDGSVDFTIPLIEIQAVIKIIDTQPEPIGVAVNPATNRIYVSHKTDDTVSVIDGFSNTVIKTIIVGDQPAGVAVNPGQPHENIFNNT